MTRRISAIPLSAIDAVVFDTETTGLDVKTARIIQIGGVRLQEGEAEPDGLGGAGKLGAAEDRAPGRRRPPGGQCQGEAGNGCRQRAEGTEERDQGDGEGQGERGRVEQGREAR